MNSITWTQHEADARDRFDDWSQSATFRRLKPWLMYLQSRVLEHVNWHAGLRLLDVACGSGWAVHQAARRVHPESGGLACGCDLSAGMLSERALSPELSRPGVLLAASAQSLPYRDASFDVVMCTAAFHHFPDPLEALRGFQRVLRPGGRLIIADACRDCGLGAFVWDRLHRWFEKGHVQYYRRGEFRDLFIRAGFQQIEVRRLFPTYQQTRKLVRGAVLVIGRVAG